VHQSEIERWTETVDSQSFFFLQTHHRHLRSAFTDLFCSHWFILSVQSKSKIENKKNLKNIFTKRLFHLFPWYARWYLVFCSSHLLTVVHSIPEKPIKQ